MIHIIFFSLKWNNEFYRMDRSICLSANISHFHLFQNHWSNFILTWHKEYVVKVTLLEMIATLLIDWLDRVLRRIGNLKLLYIDEFNKNFFSRTIGPISSKHDSKDFWEKGNFKFIKWGIMPF